jgi:hypothetical protein
VAELVVERPGRGHRRAEPGQQLGHEVFCGRLPAGAGDADDGHLWQPAQHRGGQAAERRLHVRHHDRRHADRPRREHGDRAGGDRVASMLVAVHPLAA